MTEAESTSRAEPRPVLPRALLVSWAAAVGAAMLLALGVSVQSADYPTPLVLEHAYRLLVGFELFFLLVLVPAVSPRTGMLGPVLACAMAAPMVLIAAWVSDADAPSVAASQAYLLAAACFVGACLGADRGGRWRGTYWLALGLLGGGAPFLAFVLGDFLRADFGWLYALSPFWVADRLSRGWAFDWVWAAPFLAMVGLAGALGVAAWGRAVRDRDGEKGCV